MTNTEQETDRERYYREREEMRIQMFENQPERTEEEIREIHAKTSRRCAYENRVRGIQDGYYCRGLFPLQAIQSEIKELEEKLLDAQKRLGKAQEREVSEKRNMERWLAIAKNQYEAEEQQQKPPHWTTFTAA